MSSSFSKMSLNKTTFVVGGVALASLALLAYSLTRPTKQKSRSSKGKRTSIKFPKFTKKYDKKPIECHLVMFNDLGFSAHVAADKKNKGAHLKYGARLIYINGRRVENHTYEDIFDLLTKAKLPITLKFREFPELEQQWIASEVLKDAANVLYKKGDFSSGIAKVSEAIVLHPTNKTYYSNRVLMYLKSTQYELALVDCQKIRELDPKSVFIKGHYLRGLVLFNLNKYKNAASAFQTVIKLNPNFKQATVRLNDCLQLLENEDKEHKKRRSSEHEELKKALLNFNTSDDRDILDINDNMPAEEVPKVTPMKSKANESLSEMEEVAEVPNAEVEVEVEVVEVAVEAEVVEELGVEAEVIADEEKVVNVAVIEDVEESKEVDVVVEENTDNDEDIRDVSVDDGHASGNSSAESSTVIVDKPMVEEDVKVQENVNEENIEVVEDVKSENEVAIVNEEEQVLDENNNYNVNIGDRLKDDVYIENDSSPENEENEVNVEDNIDTDSIGASTMNTSSVSASIAEFMEK